MSFELNTIITAPAVMTSLMLFFGIILAAAYRLLRVDEDPRIQHAEELLPGTNCGACGEPGCLPFAIKLVHEEVQASQCTVASTDDIEALADFLGVDPGTQDKRVARLRCAGGKAQAFQIAEYQGFESCRAAAVISGGGKGCSWGCLGLADCEVVCTFDAIQLNGNGLPVVDIDKCTACGDCVDVCPKELFEIIPLNQKLYVQCASPLEGAAILALCTVACDACNKCATDAAPGLITMENNLPTIDYGAGGPAKPDATYRCATNTIQWLEGGQFQDSSSQIGKKRYA